MELLQVLISGVLIGATYALVSSGLSLIYGVMHIVNLSHGALLILAAYLTFTLWSGLGIDPVLGILLTTPTLFGLGWLLYTVVIRPVGREVGGAALLLTFGLGLILEAVMGWTWGNVTTSTLPSYADAAVRIGPLYLPTVQILGFGLTVAVLVCLAGFLRHSWTGRAIRAAAANPEGAELVGITVGRVAAFTFALGVAATASGGAIVAMMSPIVPGSSLVWLIRMLAIVVLGGMGSLSGSVLAGLVLGIVENLAAHYLGLEWVAAMPLLVVFAVLLVRPRGLLGARVREDAAA